MELKCADYLCVYTLEQDTMASVRRPTGRSLHRRWGAPFTALQLAHCHGLGIDQSPLRFARRSGLKSAPRLAGWNGDRFATTHSLLEKVAGYEYRFQMKYADRITFDPEQCGGRPCVRHYRLRVKDVLELLAAGVSEPEILDDYSFLEPEDIRACLEYAAEQVNHPVLVAA